jgi:hypothetical protein
MMGSQVDSAKMVEGMEGRAGGLAVVWVVRGWRTAAAAVAGVGGAEEALRVAVR